MSCDADRRKGQSIPARQERIICFPLDRSMGWLYIQDENNLSEDYRQLGQKLGEARGTVVVPVNKYLHLRVSPDSSSDLSPFASLKSNDLQSVSSMAPKSPILDLFI